ncbi:PLP-dependent aspartate aminotransferase family protein [Roseibium sp. RKSG952]|uniref:trans-sulfuration enzyme family protein n=1 Tax=Roseibium sp. RKSG952 TaxID=2529384 RepID=UPI0012BD0134|nr:PLP-dependent aspartate aminotransferase family protein [Roseibium sp. RKSG952]MTH97547.1 PLP-dependent transferase [Roseibium sp. RKSG952]
MDQDPRKPRLHPDSLLAHGGGTDPATGAIVPPIPLTTTFARDEAYNLVNPGHLYARDDNDLFHKTEKLIAALENGADCRLFASGMAAIAAVARTVKPGGTLVAQSGIYWGTTLFLRKHCERNDIALIETDAADLSTFSDDIAISKPGLVWLEAPSNPYLKIADIQAIAARCKAAGALLAVDATAATPLVLRPLDLGADLVVHSATKALNGHSDLLGGVVTAKDPASNAWSFICEERKMAGAVMGSFEAWLLLRGLRTLGLRVQRMNANADRLASYLENHDKIEKVLYPGLASHAGHAVAVAQMSGGFGSLMSVLVKGGKEAALTVAGALSLFQRATSLGGVESLVEHRYTIEGGTSGIPENLLRLSIGIEHLDDLKADFEQALGVL